MLFLLWVDRFQFRTRRRQLSSPPIISFVLLSLSLIFFTCDPTFSLSPFLLGFLGMSIWILTREGNLPTEISEIKERKIGNLLRATPCNLLPTVNSDYQRFSPKAQHFLLFLHFFSASPCGLVQIYVISGYFLRVGGLPSFSSGLPVPHQLTPHHGVLFYFGVSSGTPPLVETASAVRVPFRNFIFRWSAQIFPFFFFENAHSFGFFIRPPEESILYIFFRKTLPKTWCITNAVPVLKTGSLRDWNILKNYTIEHASTTFRRIFRDACYVSTSFCMSTSSTLTSRPRLNELRVSKLKTSQSSPFPPYV